MKKKLVLFFTLTFINSGFAGAITGVAGFRVSYCASSTISATFDYFGFGSSNNFKIELSDSTGSFLSGTQFIGAVNSSLSHDINQLILGVVPDVSGNNYLIRIIEINSLTTSGSTPVIINQKPVITSGAVKSICNNNSVNLVFTCNVSSNYTWLASSNANVNGESATIQSGSILNDILTNTTSADQIVVYTVTPTSSVSSCAGSSQIVNVIVHPQSVIPIGDTSQNFTQGQTLTDLQVTGNNLIWYANQSDAINHVNPIVNTTLLVNGLTYYVTQTNNGCESAPLGITVTMVLDINDFQKDKFIYYPNPTNYFLNIQTSDGEILNKIIITDVMGKIVLEQNQNTSKINVEQLARGMYILQVTSGSDIFTRKFIKE